MRCSSQVRREIGSGSFVLLKELLSTMRWEHDRILEVTELWGILCIFRPVGVCITRCFFAWMSKINICEQLAGKWIVGASYLLSADNSQTCCLLAASVWKGDTPLSHRHYLRVTCAAVGSSHRETLHLSLLNYCSFPQSWGTEQVVRFTLSHDAFRDKEWVERNGSSCRSVALKMTQWTLKCKP